MAPRTRGRRRTKDRSGAATGVRRVSGANGVHRIKRPDSVEGFFDGNGKLLVMYDHDDVYAWFQRRHEKGTKFIEDDGYIRRNGSEWRVPFGVREALKTRLLWTQMNNRYPFFVTWVSPKTGKRLKKSFETIAHAMVFITEKAQHVDPEACVVSKHGFPIPTKLMGKFPRRMGPKNQLHYWCPRCMAPRRFRRLDYVSTFHAMKKFWSEEKQQFIWKDVKVAVIECTVCGITNRDTRWRMSNQPVEKRRFKKGVRRAKKRKVRR